ELVRFDGGAHHLAVTSFADLDRGAMAVARGRIPRRGACMLVTPAELARMPATSFDLAIFEDAQAMPVAHALGALARAQAAIVVGAPPARRARGAGPGTCTAAPPPPLSRGPALAVLPGAPPHVLSSSATRRYYGDALGVLPAARRGRALIWRQIDGAADALGA